MDEYKDDSIEVKAELTVSVKTESEDLEAIHMQAMRDYQSSFDAEEDQREKCLFDMKFCHVEGSQWETLANEARSKRPRFEINKVAGPVSTIIGAQRQNRVSMKIRPVSGGANKDTAEVLNGLVRAINTVSRFEDIKDSAFVEQATSGIGGWYITTQYADDGFDQEIVIKPIVSAASSVYYDASATGAMKEDASWFMVTEDISRASFEARYPDASIGNLPNYATGMVDWQNRDTVRIADYWVKEPYTKTVAQLSDGSVIELDKDLEMVKDELATQGITIIKTRKVDCHKVKMYKVSAGEVLEGPFEWAGKHIPVVVFFGYNVWIDGNHYYKGMVRNAIDAQRTYNYATSSAVEAAALSPKDPIWVTPTQIKGHEGQLREYLNKNSPFMMYNPDPDAAGIPQRGGAPQVQQALIQQVVQADSDIQSTTGQFSPSLGQEQDQSGRAILALQRKGSENTFVLLDNLDKAIEYTGTIILDLIPKIYDTEREVTLFGNDGETISATINKTVLDLQTGQEIKLHDLSKGKYSLEASTAPSFETQRVENVNTLTRLAESNPTLAPLITDLIVSQLDNEMSEELTKRIRKQMIGEGLVEPTEEEAQELLPAMEAQQAHQKELQRLELERAILQNKLIEEQILNFQASTGKVYSDINQDQSDQQEVLSKTNLNNAKAIKEKVEASQILDEMGIPNNVPLSEEELLLSQRTADIMLSLTDPEPQQGIPQQPTQPQGGELPPEIPQ